MSENERYVHSRPLPLGCLYAAYPQVPAFLGFVKREISRRYGPKIGWSGTMWDEYVATALPTAESQVNCLRYLLSQATKEGLTESPLDWPGIHVAKALLADTPLRGHWLDATAYGRAVQKQRARRKPKRLDKASYFTEYEVRLAKIPAWDEMSDAEYQRRVRGLVDEIVVEGRELRAGRRPLGPRQICATSRGLKQSLPRPPWYEERRRMICWSDPRAAETKAYIDRYWTFQRAFRLASRAAREGKPKPAFPVGAFRPMRFCCAPDERRRRQAA